MMTIAREMPAKYRGVSGSGVAAGGVGPTARIAGVRTKVDLTDRMVTWAGNRVWELEKESLSGFVFKGGSPWSGMERVRVYQRPGFLQ